MYCSARRPSSVLVDSRHASPGESHSYSGSFQIEFRAHVDSIFDQLGVGIAHHENLCHLICTACEVTKQLRLGLKHLRLPPHRP